MPDAFLPNFFLLGAAKCGTTTLWSYLDKLPDVCMSNPKEPRFFTEEYGRGAEFYRRTYFAHWKGEAVVGDAAHQNLTHGAVAAPRIHAAAPDGRLMVILRNPVERTHSGWYNRHWRRKEPLGFKETIAKARAELGGGGDPAPEDGPAFSYHKYLTGSHYMELLDHYLAYFPRERLKIVLFDDMVSKPLEVMAGVVRFLALDEQRNRVTEPIWENATRVAPGLWRPPKLVRKLTRAIGLGRLVDIPEESAEPRSARPEIDPEVRPWLSDYYRPHNARLAEFIGRDLSHWE